MDLSPRVRAVCDLDVSEVREYAGRHEYDGKPQDLSPAGVRAGLARLAAARAGGERLAGLVSHLVERNSAAALADLDQALAELRGELAQPDRPLIPAVW